ncbi:MULTISPECIES: hypothetical protein [unclassified Deinococcus]|uniref:hypothetical protein n=1 Tax=unclassified Deinococcus TaxID=2623546 RepID=UPI001C301FA5|nr:MULTISPECIES: hypothetical protein [unclassified Deinococcus]MDK2014049.1 hypothetical protein [Deinococcus sp. 43]
MNPTDTLVLTTLVLMGAISAASATRIGGTLPFTLLLPPVAVVSVTVLPHPAGLLIAAALTVLTFTLAFAPRPQSAPLAAPITSHHAFAIALALFFVSIAFAAVQRGIPAPAYAIIIGLTAGCLGAAHTLNPTPELAPYGQTGWRVMLALITLLTFAIGATFTEWIGFLSAATLLLITVCLQAYLKSSPLGSPR